MNIRHERRTVNGVRLHCAVAGTGPLLILLHGFPEFWYSWRHQIPPLAKHFTVVAPDMRGYNQSDQPRRVEEYAIDRLVDDVIGLLHSFGEERAVVAGHDWGGGVAWNMALRAPDAVDKLIILNSPHPRLFIQNLVTNPRQLGRSAYIFFFQLPWLPEAMLRRNDYEFLERAFRESAVHPEQFPDEVIEQYKQAARNSQSLTGALNYYRAAARQGLAAVIPPHPVVRAPTLVIWGEQDFALGKELNDNLDRYVPELTLRFIPDASHWVQQDCPELVTQYMLEFLMQQP